MIRASAINPEIPSVEWVERTFICIYCRIVLPFDLMQLDHYAPQAKQLSAFVLMFNTLQGYAKVSDRLTTDGAVIALNALALSSEMTSRDSSIDYNSLFKKKSLRASINNLINLYPSCGACNLAKSDHLDYEPYHGQILDNRGWRCVVVDQI